tara:strand:+ start:9460 stop:10194 length:735 start_codon:yes stop_codon:yes gene_type:complete
MYELPILTYHRIISRNAEKGKDKIFVSLKNFENQLKYLKTKGFDTITFRDIEEENITDFSKKVILTFDDGYKCNYQYAFPLLKKYNFKAVIFLVTQKKFNNWKKHPYEPLFPLLNKDEILEMDKYGIEFGGHSQTHPILTEIALDNVFHEIRGCKNDLEQLLNKPVFSFSYPYGAFNNNVKEIVKESGFKYAVSTNAGAKDFRTDTFCIKRINISPKTNIYSFKNKTSGKYLKKKNIFTLLNTH